MATTLPAHYRDGNRAFLQAFMSRGYMTADEARPVLAAIFSADEDAEVSVDQITTEDFKSYLATMQEVLSFYDYEIRVLAHQVTKKKIFALVNTTSDPMTQLATTFSNEELNFLKRLLEAMFDKYNTQRMEIMALTSMEAIKLARPPKRQNNSTQNNDEEDEADQSTQAPTQTQSAATDKGLTHSEVETMLGKLQDEGWLEKSGRGFYSLSPRALMELRTWLIDMFNDPDAEPGDWQRIKFCVACKDIITHGMRCAEPDCHLRLHDICDDAFWRTQRGKQCPACSTPWSGKHFVGERAVTESAAYNRHKSRGGPNDRPSNGVVHEDEPEDDG